MVGQGTGRAGGCSRTRYSILYKSAPLGPSSSSFITFWARPDRALRDVLCTRRQSTQFHSFSPLNQPSCGHQSRLDSRICLQPGPGSQYAQCGRCWHSARVLDGSTWTAAGQAPNAQGGICNQLSDYIKEIYKNTTKKMTKNLTNYHALVFHSAFVYLKRSSRLP